MLILEVFDTDLDEDIQLKKSTGKIFSEDELWDMADNLISALAYLQNHGLSHRGIRTTSILCCKGNYKLNYVPSVARYLT
jgi:serine/threonine protein kinase